MPRVRLTQTEDGSLALVFPPELTEQTGWKPGDEVVIHASYSGTMLMLRAWSSERPLKDVDA